MPTWSQILTELNSTQAPQGQGPDYDGVRRKYLAALSQRTGRAVILYTTAFLESRPVSPADLQISLIDMQGMMEVVAGVKEKQLDLILHSPGGSAEAAESIAEYLRTRFDHIRVFVPLAAMSAATMLALSADEIVMGAHSQLGPIDPQFNITTPEGPRSAPAKAIEDQFAKAKEECRDPANLAAWMPILRSYAPGLLAQCEHQQRLAKSMVQQWLAKYMFKGRSDAEQKASDIAGWFASYDNFDSHGRAVRFDKVKELGLNVSPLEDDDLLQDAVLSVHHAAMHTLTGTAAVKIVENHMGRAFVMMRGAVLVQQQPQAPGQAQPVTIPAARGPAQLSRPERRRQQFGR